MSKYYVSIESALFTPHTSNRVPQLILAESYSSISRKRCREYDCAITFFILDKLSCILRLGVKIKVTHFTEIVETVEARV